MVSDCDAIKDQAYRYASNEACAAAGVQAGCDQDCGGFYGAWGLQALQQGLLKQEELTRAVARTLLMRFKLGEFEPDPAASVPFTRIPAGTSNSSASAQSALRAARESIVLLNNSAALLPLRPTAASAAAASAAAAPIKLAVLGPLADDADAMQGGKSDYNPSHVISYLEGLSARKAELAITYAEGCGSIKCPSDGGFAAAVAAAKAADVTFIALGIDHTIEAEGHDRSSTGLPGMQLQLLQQVVAAVGADKVVVGLSNGGALATDWIAAHVPTVLELFQGGQWAGAALADVLLGAYSPSGVLPYTIYPASFITLNSMDDFGMRPNASSKSTGHTYRFYEGPAPLWPFGHGLSFARFSMAFSSTKLPPATTAALVPAPEAGHTPGLAVALTVTNTGAVAGAKAVLFFVSRVGDAAAPKKTLVSVQKVHLEPGASATLHVTSDAGAELGYCAFCTVATDGSSKTLAAGEFEISVGDGVDNVATTTVMATGATVTLPL